MAIGDKKCQQDQGNGKMNVTVDKDTCDGFNAYRTDGRYGYHLCQVKNGKEENDRPEEVPEPFVCDVQADAKEKAIGCSDGFTAFETGKDRETVPDGTCQPGIDDGIRRQEIRHSHGKECFDGIEQSDGNSCRFAKDSSGICPSDIAAAFLTDIFVIENYTDHQSPRYRAEQVADEDNQNQIQHKLDLRTVF